MRNSNRPIRLERLDHRRWLEFSAGFLDLNYRQLWTFAQIAAQRVRAQSTFLAMFEGDRPIALANVRVRTLPMGLGGVAYIAGGPLVCRRDLEQSAWATNLEHALGTLQHEFCRRRGLVLRVVPPLWPEELRAAATAAALRQRFGPAPTLRARATTAISIQPDENAIRQRMKPRWRGSLNSALKKGLHVQISSEPDAIDGLIEPYELHERGRGFHADLGARFFARAQQGMPADERFAVIRIEHNGELQAAHVGAYVGSYAMYVLGLTTDAGRKSNAAYLAQWTAIQHARQNGCTVYDLNGIDPVGNPGVTAFKLGLGGDRFFDPGPFESRGPMITSAIVLASERALKLLRPAGAPTHNQPMTVMLEGKGSADQESAG